MNLKGEEMKKRFQAGNEEETAARIYRYKAQANQFPYKDVFVFELEKSIVVSNIKGG